MRQITNYTSLILLTLLMITSCQKKFLCPDCEINKPPIANAGPDQTIILPKDSTILDGSNSSDADGKIVFYKWQIISGPFLSNIIKKDSVKTSVKGLVTGDYQFELLVTDDKGSTARDTVQISVNAGNGINQPPVACAGADQVITLPTNSVNLNGSCSTDPENNITNYAWTKILGPTSFNITNANSVQIQVTNLVQGVYQFELKVTDAGGLFAKDTLQVTVNNVTQSDCSSISEVNIGVLSIPRSSVSILAAGNKIVFAGGFDRPLGPPDYGASNRVDIYDQLNQNWSTHDLSSTRMHMGTIASDSKIYFAGGYNGGASSRVDIYDVRSNTWSVAELNEARSSIIAVTACNKVVFAGGYANSGASSKIDIYDETSGSWSTAKLSNAVAGSYPGKYVIEQSGVYSIGNKIYFFTGNNTIDVYDALSNSWSIQNARLNQTYGRVSFLNNKIYLPGTTPINPNPGYANSLEILDLATNAWSSVTMIHPRSNMCQASGDGKIFWAGGIDSSWTVIIDEYNRCVDNIEMYDVNTGLHSVHPLQSQQCFIVSLKTNNHIFFAVTDLYAEMYNINTRSWSICNKDFFQSIAIGNTVFQLAADNKTVWRLEY